MYIAVGIFSLCIGSFLNVAIYRTPKMMEQEWRTDCQLFLHPEQPIIDETKITLSTPASTCPKCKTPIRWYQNIPGYQLDRVTRKMWKLPKSYQ